MEEAVPLTCALLGSEASLSGSKNLEKLSMGGTMRTRRSDRRRDHEARGRLRWLGHRGAGKGNGA
jgi:hypothetical protein